MNVVPAVQADTLNAVTVIADRGVVVSKSETVKLKSTISITDALEAVPGITLGDYGGFAGLKTVSLRGLGSAHTAIYIDGVRLGNISSGQADLGNFDFGGFAGAVIDYAQNSLSFVTAKPVFDGSPFAGNLSLRGGSFGTWQGQGRFDFRLSDKVCASASVNGLSSKGNFPYGDEGKMRANNDIRKAGSTVDFWGKLRGGQWHTKAFFNSSDRGTPGSTDWPSTDRQKDKNAFLQGVLQEQVTERYSILASAKGSYDDLKYLSEWGDSDYVQKEAQLNLTQNFAATSWLDASLTLDWQWDGLQASIYGSPCDMSRSTALATASASFHPKGFDAVIALELANYSDKGAESRTVLSPSVQLRKGVIKGLDIVAFARRAYRMPTFNELYYPGFGNSSLKAEDALLSDIGAEWRGVLCPHLSFSTKLDFFWNSLKNKIVSVPTEADPSIWQPYNVGLARMLGGELQAGIQYSGDGVRSSLNARYSINDAVDRTPDSYSFGEQLPFVARNNFSLSADASWKGWEGVLSYALHTGRNGSSGPMPSYNTLNISVGKDFRIKDRMSLSLKLHARNLADCRYELAAGYPMPGRSLCGEIGFRF